MPHRFETRLLQESQEVTQTENAKSKNFVTGFYKLAFNNETNDVEIVLNSSEGSTMDIIFNEYRLSRSYDVKNSEDNKVKKIFNEKKNAIEREIKKTKSDGSKSVEVRKQEVKRLNDEMSNFYQELAKKHPNTYTAMVLSKMKSPFEKNSYQFFDDIDFNDERIIRSNLMPSRIQQYMVYHSKYDKVNNKYGFYDAVDFIMDKAKVNERD